MEELIEKIKRLAEEINKCTLEWYARIMPDGYDVEFTGCCDEDEINIIIECYEIFLKNHSYVNKNVALKNTALKAIIAYYYSTQVFEHGVDPLPTKKNRKDYFCLSHFLFTLPNIYPTANMMVFEISTSNAPWASLIRRKVLNFEDEPIQELEIILDKSPDDFEVHLVQKDKWHVCVASLCFVVLAGTYIYHYLKSIGVLMPNGNGKTKRKHKRNLRKSYKCKKFDKNILI